MVWSSCVPSGRYGRLDLRLNVYPLIPPPLVMAPCPFPWACVPARACRLCIGRLWWRWTFRQELTLIPCWTLVRILWCRLFLARKPDLTKLCNVTILGLDRLCIWAPGLILAVVRVPRERECFILKTQARLILMCPLCGRLIFITCVTGSLLPRCEGSAMLLALLFRRAFGSYAWGRCSVVSGPGC